jgi:hypothetical protein
MKPLVSKYQFATLPLSDGLHRRRFPIVNVALIAANFAVWLLYQLPHLNSAVYHASFYSCIVDNACHGREPWGISWFTAAAALAVGAVAFGIWQVRTVLIFLVLALTLGAPTLGFAS